MGTKRRRARQLWRWLRKRRAARRRARKAAAAKAAKTQQAASKPREHPLLDHWHLLVHQRIADWRGDKDAPELEKLRQGSKRVLLDRRHTLLCHAHTPPMKFASAWDFNEHLMNAHPTKGAQPRRLPQPTGRKGNPPPRPAPRRQPQGEKPVTRTMVPDQRVLEAKLAAWAPYIDQIRVKAVTNMSATTGVQLLGDIGSTPIQSVSQIRELALALEAVGQALEEAAEGFMRNARTSEHAPIDEEVLSALRPVVDGGQQVAQGATAFLAEFEDFYGDDIRAAQAGERISNAALTH